MSFVESQGHGLARGLRALSQCWSIIPDERCQLADCHSCSLRTAQVEGKEEKEPDDDQLGMARQDVNFSQRGVFTFFCTSQRVPCSGFSTKVSLFSLRVLRRWGAGSGVAGINNLANCFSEQLIYLTGEASS